MTENTSRQSRALSPEPIDVTGSGTAEDLQRFEITAHQHTSYEWSGYRYSNASDAIAAARRAAR